MKDDWGPVSRYSAQGKYVQYFLKRSVPHINVVFVLLGAKYSKSTF